MFTTENNIYRIEYLSAVTIQGALNIIKKTFLQDEPVCIALGINKNLVATEEVLELCAEAALDGVSLVAVEIETGEVVAAIFNKIQVFASDPLEKSFYDVFAEERCTQDSSKSLIQFMNYVDGKCSLFQKYRVDCSFELIFLVTQREHRKQKLGELLCKYSVEVAKMYKHGYTSNISVEDLGDKYCHIKPRSPTKKYPKICQAIWSTEGSQKIGKKLEFEVHATVPFDSYTYKGKTYFESIDLEAIICELAAIAL